MNLDDWARTWAVSDAALADLRARLGIHGVPAPVAVPLHSEAWAQQQVRLEAARLGIHLWRNNSGAFKDENGRWVRYGICNDSKQLNARFKSCDLLGIKPNGQFVAREIKPPGWRYTGTEREIAQRNWIELVCASGGDAGFATGPGTL